MALIKIRFIGIVVLLDRPESARGLLDDLDFRAVSHGREARQQESRRSTCAKEIGNQNKNVYDAVHGPVCYLKSVAQAQYTACRTNSCWKQTPGRSASRQKTVLVVFCPDNRQYNTTAPNISQFFPTAIH